jgi:cellulose synthase/poly-beta-1,6-N-acetylglucosamine synthase-like glycosyltransferase
VILLTFIFWSSLAAVVYSYLGYALLLYVSSRLFGRDLDPPEVIDEELPTASLLIAAHNEEQFIAQRVENALAMDYPREKLEIVVASDGSTDRTNEMVRQYADQGVRLLDFPQRRGKSTMLNDGIQQVGGEIVMLTDANTFFEPDAAKKLVRWFSDPKIGFVCGRLILLDPRTGGNVDGLYWKYETFLKQCENRLGGLLGANGAIYAIRRSVYVPIPGETIVDDFVIPLLSRLRHRLMIHYDSTAVAREESPPTIRDEFRRRTRIGAGGFQSLQWLWPLMLPTHGWLAVTFISHKVLRWFCPFFLLAALVANLFLLDQPLYQALLVGQLVFYALSLVGMFVQANGLVPRLLRLTTMFTSMNLALFLGFWKWLAGRQKGVWQRTERGVTEPVEQ